MLWKQYGKKDSFLDPIIKKESKKVDLGKYATHSSWGDSLKNGIQQGHTRKGMFNPHDRPLHTNDVIKTAIKRHVPAPGTYEASKGNKPILGFSTVSDIGSYHVDEAVYHAKQTPQVCYKELSSLTFLTKPRHLDTKIPPPKLTVQEAAAKPKKSQDPDMGTYEAPKSKDFFKD